MSSSSSFISVAASAQKLDVDNRISLRYYYRIADNLLRKADIYREEKNVIDLYIMLLRFSSLITETIPYHKDYQVLLRRERLSCRKKLLNALTELETLKPLVLSRIEELSRKHTNQVNRWHRVLQNRSNNSSLEWPPIKKQTPTNYAIGQVYQSAGLDGKPQGSWNQRDKISRFLLVDEKFSKLSLSIPRPKEETLSRHSILGPNGLHGHWHPPIIDKGVQYPINLDSTPIENPSLHRPFEGGVTIEKDQYKSEPEKSTLESVLQLNDGRWSLHAEEPRPTVISDTAEAPVQTDIIRQPSPPPVLADVHDLMSITSTQVTDLTSGPEKSFQDELVCHERPSQLHISTQMMDSFMRLAKSNTDRNLETCGILSGSLEKRTFYVTSLIIPKQESTSDFCQTTNEEEIFDVQDKQSLFPLGWIHTLSAGADFGVQTLQIGCRDHSVSTVYCSSFATLPSSRSCDECPVLSFAEAIRRNAACIKFIDTSYTVLFHVFDRPPHSLFISGLCCAAVERTVIMLPEAIAIVMAPKDSSRTHGIFRLTAPGGMSLIRQCQQRGFHPHDEPPDGGPIYDHCTDVYMNPSLKFDVIDLR